MDLNSQEVAHFCKKGNIIVIDKDTKKVGIINSFRIEESRDKAIVIVNGYTAKGLTKTKIIVPPTKEQKPQAFGWESIEGNAETIIKHFVSRNMTNAYDRNRNIKNMIIADNTNFGKVFNWRARYTNLAEELEQICTYGEIGYNIQADLSAKKWVFDVVKGVDRTKKQKEVSPVVFRTEYSNISEYTYAEDNMDSKNTFYAGGEGKDENRLVYILNGENTGIEREEVFLDLANAKNITDLTFLAKQQLKDYESKNNIEVLTLPSPFEFEKAYFLGDKVTVIISKLGLEIDTIVTSVVENWEREGYNCQLKFGSEIPSIFKIKRSDWLIG